MKLLVTTYNSASNRRHTFSTDTRESASSVVNYSNKTRQTTSSDTSAAASTLVNKADDFNRYICSYLIRGDGFSRGTRESATHVVN